MRRIKLSEEDLVNMVMEHYDARPSEVIAGYETKVNGYSLDPVFYIEVNINDEGE